VLPDGAPQTEDCGATVFFSQFGETSRVVRYFADPPNVVGSWIFDLYRRHAAAVCDVFERAIVENKSGLRKGLPSTCLLRLVIGTSEGEVRFEPPRPACKIDKETEEIRITIDEANKKVSLRHSKQCGRN